MQNQQMIHSTKELEIKIKKLEENKLTKIERKNEKDQKNDKKDLYSNIALQSLDGLEPVPLVRQNAYSPSSHSNSESEFQSCSFYF